MSERARFIAKAFAANQVTRARAESFLRDRKRRSTGWTTAFIENSPADIERKRERESEREGTLQIDRSISFRRQDSER